MIEYCAYVEECNNRVAYNEATKNSPTRGVLHPNTASEAHSLAYVLKGIKKRIELLTLYGDQYALPPIKALADMPGSVSFVTSFYELNT